MWRKRAVGRGREEEARAARYEVDDGVDVIGGACACNGRDGNEIMIPDAETRFCEFLEITQTWLPTCIFPVHVPVPVP